MGLEQLSHETIYNIVAKASSGKIKPRIEEKDDERTLPFVKLRTGALAKGRLLIQVKMSPGSISLYEECAAPGSAAILAACARALACTNPLHVKVSD